MENQNNNHEEMPKAQSMKAVDKKHMTLVYAGLGCWLLGLIFSEMRFNAPGMIFTVIGLVLNCIGLYKTFKHRKITKDWNKTYRWMVFNTISAQIPG